MEFTKMWKIKEAGKIKEWEKKSRDFFGDSYKWRCHVRSSTWNSNLCSGQKLRGCKHLGVAA